jgi:hypothetical protein
LSESFDIGGGRIDVAADPLQPLGVLFMAWIGNQPEEFAVAPGPADILWRAASDCFDEMPIGGAGMLSVMRSINRCDADRGLPPYNGPPVEAAFFDAIIGLPGPEQVAT